MENKVPYGQEPPEIPLDPPFSKGKTHIFYPLQVNKLSSLEKGGREGFRGRPFQTTKLLHVLLEQSSEFRRKNEQTTISEMDS